MPRSVALRFYSPQEITTTHHHNKPSKEVKQNFEVYGAFLPRREPTTRRSSNGPATKGLRFCRKIILALVSDRSVAALEACAGLRGNYPAERRA